MRKLYHLLTLLAICLVGFSAKADDFTITLNMPGSNMAYLTVNPYGDTYTVDLVEGDNVINFGDKEYAYMVVTPYDGYQVTGVTQTSNGNGVGYSSSTGWSFSVYADTQNGESFSVSVADLAALRTSTCYVKVDNLDKVKIQRGGTYTTVTVPTANEYCPVTFIPDQENVFYVGTYNYDDEIYKILLNGEQQTLSYYNQIYVNDGDYLEVYADFPDVDCTVTFEYSEGAEGAITSVVAGDQDVDFSNGFTAKAGTKVYFYGDTSLYKFNSISLNGTPADYFYGSYNFTLTENTTIYVDAEKYTTYTVHVNVDDASHVTMYKNYSTEVELVDGDNYIELTDNSNTLSLRPNTDCFIYSVYDNTASTEYVTDSPTSYSVYLYGYDGMDLTVTTGALTFDDTFCIYVDDLDAAPYGYGFTRSDYEYLDLVSGYNLVPFSTTLNPYQFTPYGVNETYPAYVNDEAIDPPYTNSTYYRFSFADGDVAKVFLHGTPDINTVNVTYPESGVEALQIKKDYLREVEADATSFVAVGPTLVQVYLTAEEDATVSVLFNNEMVALNEETGAYEFTATESGDLVITAEGSGVATIATEKAASNAVYSIDGVMIYRNASADQVKALPAGLYIINNKKVIVK